MPDDAAQAAAQAGSSAERTAMGMLAEGVSAARSLRSAAQQQQQQADADAQKRFQVEEQMRKAGAVLLPDAVTQEGSGLKRRQAAPVDDPNHIVTDPWGRKWHYPTTEESAAAKRAPLDNSNSVPVGAGLAADLEKAGVQGYKPGDRVPHALLGALDEQANRGRKQDAEDSKEQQGVLREGGLPVSDSGTVAQNIGVTRSRMDESGNLTPAGSGTHEAPDETTGSVVTAGGKPYYLASKQPAPKPEKPEKPEKEPRAETPNDWVRIATDPASDTGEVKRANAALKLHAEYTRRADPAAGEKAATAAQAAKDRAEAKRQAGEDATQKQIDAYQKQEQEQHGLRSAYGNALKAKDGEKIVDPKTGQTFAMNAARRAYYKQKYDAATEQAGRLQDTQRKLIQRHGGGTGGEQPPAPAAKPASAAPQAKTASLQQVRAYAVRNKLTEAEAIKRVQAEGFSIGQ